MELTQLLQFKTIAECKTMTKAAEKLHISQPALSLSLKKLEEELEVQLFERKKNKISLNKAGEMALIYANAIIEHADKMKNSFRQYTQKNNVLALGYCDPGPMRFSVPLLQKAYSNINVTAEIMADDANALNDLLARKYDAVITLKKLEHKEVVSIPFVKEKLMLSVPEDDILAGNGSICLHNYSNREIAVYRGYSSFERKIKHFMDWLETLPNVTVYTDYFVFRQMLEQKKVLAFTTRLVRFYRNDGKRVILPLDDDGVSTTYWISYHQINKKHLEPIVGKLKAETELLLKK